MAHGIMVACFRSSISPLTFYKCSITGGHTRDPCRDGRLRGSPNGEAATVLSSTVATAGTVATHGARAGATDGTTRVCVRRTVALRNGVVHYAQLSSDGGSIGGGGGGDSGSGGDGDRCNSGGNMRSGESIPTTSHDKESGGKSPDSSSSLGGCCRSRNSRRGQNTIIATTTTTTTTTTGHYASNSSSTTIGDPRKQRQQREQP